MEALVNHNFISLLNKRWLNSKKVGIKYFYSLGVENLATRTPRLNILLGNQYLTCMLFKSGLFCIEVTKKAISFKNYAIVVSSFKNTSDIN